MTTDSFAPASEAGIHRLAIPTPFAVGRVNCYLIEDEPLTLLDTGPNSGKALDELEQALAEAELAGIRRLRIPTPFAVGRVNCYLIEDEPLTLVDTGPNSGKSLDELQRQLDEAGRSIEEKYADGEISKLDGISVDYDDWHFNVRASNTEPLLRLNLESLVSKEDMERRRDEVLGLIRA